jgi:lipoyl(octanoyl) transferase
MTVEAASIAPAPVVRRLGRVRYEPIWETMRFFNQARGPATPDEIWLLEHEPVYTLGLAGREEHILDPRDVPVVHSDRGGQVTYHGPGQLVAYVMLDLKRRGLGVKDLVRRLEQSVIDFLRGHRIEGERRAGMPGIYVDSAKIAAVGLRIAHGCSYHGLSINVDLDLAPYAGIDACGYPDLASTRLADHGFQGGVDDVEEPFLACLHGCLTRA